MKKHAQSAFSLMELSIVLLIIGLMIGGIMAALTQDTRRAKQSELAVKMDTIEKALSAFVKKNGRLPCPADRTNVPTSEYFGKEATPSTSSTISCIVSAANYTGGFRTANPSPPQANLYTGNIVGGTIPVHSIGLPDEYMFDPWGGRFTYVVDMRMTTADTNLQPFDSYAPTMQFSSLTVNDADGSARADNVIAVVISHGQNGHGAFQISGSIKNAGITNLQELDNCSCSSSAANNIFNGVFVQQGATSNATDMSDNFDDAVRYYTRGNFLNMNDLNSEH